MDRFVQDRSGSNHFDLRSLFTLAVLDRFSSIPGSAFALAFRNRIIVNAYMGVTPSLLSM